MMSSWKDGNKVQDEVEQENHLSHIELSPCLLLILLSAVFVFLLNIVVLLMMMTMNIRCIIMVVRNHQAQPMLNDRDT